MPIGAGLTPAGSSSAGYGEPGSGALPNNAILPDTQTSFPQTGRYLNPATKDYEFTSDGRLYGMGTVEQLVQLALTTTLGSSCLATLGETFTLIQEKGSNYQQQVASAVGNSLADVVNRNLVQVISVTVQEPPSNPDAGFCRVVWTDLTTGLEFTTVVGS